MDDVLHIKRKEMILTTKSRDLGDYDLSELELMVQVKSIPQDADDTA